MKRTRKRARTVPFKIPRKLVIGIVVLVVVVVGNVGLKSAGIDVARAVTEARCRSGAFIHHSLNIQHPSGEASLGQSVASNDDLKPPVLVGKNLIANPGFELVTRGATRDWSFSHFGDNDAAGEIVAGPDASRAARVTISTYKEGASNWFYTPVAVTPGGYYAYTDAYRSTTNTRAVLTLIQDDGVSKYVNLTPAPASAGWSNYQVSFFVPDNVRKVAVLHGLSAQGSLDIDNVALTAAQPSGFARPMLSVTFDDGWSSIHSSALPLMERYGVVSTQYIVSGYLGQSKEYFKPSDVYDFRAAGHEIASHTESHANLTKIDDKDVKNEVERSHKGLTKCFGEIESFAAPFGAMSDPAAVLIKDLYTTARSTDVGYNTADNLNPYSLLVQNIYHNTTNEQLIGWINTAKRHNAWLILVYHQVDSSDNLFARSPENLERDLKTITSSDIEVQTVREAYQAIILDKTPKIE